jgi:ornithine cyclodeaminase/alanine dehydrogenase-like protein (mu-crystallin family)
MGDVVKIVNALTGDVGISNGLPVVLAISDCGRVSYTTGSSGPYVDDRWTGRGYYYDMASGRPTGEPVDPRNWELACRVIEAANEALQLELGRMRQLVAD